MECKCENYAFFAYSIATEDEPLSNHPQWHRLRCVWAISFFSSIVSSQTEWIGVRYNEINLAAQIAWAVIWFIHVNWECKWLNWDIMAQRTLSTSSLFYRRSNDFDQWSKANKLIPHSFSIYVNWLWVKPTFCVVQINDRINSTEHLIKSQTINFWLTFTFSSAFL